MQLWIEAIKGVLKSRGDETEVLLLLHQLSLISTQKYVSKPIEELEKMYVGLDDAMNKEINELLDTFSKDKDEIIDILTERDIAELKRTIAQDRSDIIAELKRRGV
jgi:hypothetical protein